MGTGDTIVALSSGRLPAGVAVLRLSGSDCRFALETISGRVPEPRKATFSRIRDRSGAVLDEGIVLFFEGPHSYTGEDLAEIHLHGSRAVVGAVLGLLTSLARIRHAEPGEFTRRAFLNGKLDLLAAEAVADLVNAETEAQRRLAVFNREGAQTELYGDWRRRLIEARAMIEADLDFSDEADVPGAVAQDVWPGISDILAEIRSHIEGYRRAEIIRDGFDVVIIGPPNAGKSSLLNAMSDRDAAIVSDEPGTTRDLVEVALDLGGLKVRLTDTAGMREGAGKVEAIGIARARDRARKADLVLQLRDLTGSDDRPDLDGLAGPVRVGTKVDRLDAAGRVRAGEDCQFLVSSLTAEGIPELLDFLGARAADAAGAAGEVLPSRSRHVSLLREAADALERALRLEGAGMELRAEELRYAGERLGRISGAVDVEDLLDVIFSQFCIGK